MPKSSVMIFKDKLIESVNDFIDTITFKDDKIKYSFLNGNCYWFARILQERFNPWLKADIMYNSIKNHFCCRLNTGIGSFYFDASGLIESHYGWLEWKTFIESCPTEAAKIYRDCIWKLSEEEWNQLIPPFQETPWLY